MDTLSVSVSYATAAKQVWLKLEVPAGTTLEEVIAQSGLLKQFPEIDLTQQKVGIFGKICALTTPLSAGDRVEVYRPITADPELVERRDVDQNEE